MNPRHSEARLRAADRLFDSEDKRILRHSLGSGATPLTITGYPEVAKRQEKVQHRLRERISRSLRDRSPLIRTFAENNFLGRFARRLDRNQASYDTRLVRDIPAHLQDTHDRVLIGDGSPKDALVVMSELRMRSIELARLTHPSIDMQDNPDLDGMHEEIYDAVTMLGGEFHEDAVPTYELSNLDTNVPPEKVAKDKAPVEHAAVREGMMATVKRHIGTMPDGTKVIQRTSYIIDLNELPVEITHAIRSVNTLESKNPLQAVSEAAQVDILLPHLIGRGSEEKSIIPVSTTIFAHNEAIAEIIKNRATPEETDAPSKSMGRFYEALEKDTAELAKIWGFTEEQRRTDRYTRGVGAHALSADEILDDD